MKEGEAKYDHLSNAMVIKTPDMRYYISGSDYGTPLTIGDNSKLYKATTTKGELVGLRVILKSNAHPDFIKSIIDTISNPPTDLRNIIAPTDIIEDDLSYYVTYQYFAEGNLTNAINNNMITNEVEAIEYFRQICYGVLMHQQMQHKASSLNTDSILLRYNTDSQYPFKYCLGMLSSFNDSIGFNNPMMYVQPYDQNSDVYSLGCMLYYMITQSHLYSCTSKEELIKEYNSKNMVPINYKPGLSQFTVKLLENCLQFDANKRIMLTDLFKQLEINELYTKYSQLKLGESNTTVDTIFLKEIIKEREKPSPSRPLTSRQIIIKTDKPQPQLSSSTQIKPISQSAYPKKEEEKESQSQNDIINQLIDQMELLKTKNKELTMQNNALLEQIKSKSNCKYNQTAYQTVSIDKKSSIEHIGNTLIKTQILMHNDACIECTVNKEPQNIIKPQKETQVVATNQLAVSNVDILYVSETYTTAHMNIIQNISNQIIVYKPYLTIPIKAMDMPIYCPTQPLMQISYKGSLFDSSLKLYHPNQQLLFSIIKKLQEQWMKLHKA